MKQLTRIVKAFDLVVLAPQGHFEDLSDRRRIINNDNKLGHTSILLVQDTPNVLYSWPPVDVHRVAIPLLVAKLVSGIARHTKSPPGNRWRTSRISLVRMGILVLLEMSDQELEHTDNEETDNDIRERKALVLHI